MRERAPLVHGFEAIQDPEHPELYIAEFEVPSVTPYLIQTVYFRHAYVQDDFLSKEHLKEVQDIGLASFVIGTRQIKYVTGIPVRSPLQTKLAIHVPLGSLISLHFKCPTDSNVQRVVGYLDILRLL